MGEESNKKDRHFCTFGRNCCACPFFTLQLTARGATPVGHVVLNAGGVAVNSLGCQPQVR